MLCFIHSFLCIFFKKGEECVPAITLPLHESLSEQIAG